MAAVRPTGRPSRYTDEVAAAIVRRLSNGEPLAAICRDEEMPGVTTVWEWQQKLPALSEAIARAREVGFDVIAAECLEISNTPVMGVETVNKPDGSIETREGDMLGHRKLQIDTRLKLLSKWDPKRYGEKQSVELSGELSLKDWVRESLSPKADDA